MKRTTIYIKVLVMAILTLSLSACVKDHLYVDLGYDEPEQPTEPEQPAETSQGGVVAVEINLPDGTGNNDFTVELEVMTLDRGDGTQFYSDPLTAGEYDVLAYNVPEGFTVTDGIAYVNTANGESGVILSQPGHLYSGIETVLVEDNDTTNLYLDVEQRTRDLNIVLTVTEGDPSRIVSITGTLSGIAGAYDLVNETLYGDPVSTNVDFTVDGDQVTADLRLLGTMGETQTLTLHIVFSNGDTMDMESDLTELLATFNDGNDPFTLTAELHLPVESGYEATVTGWENVDGGSFDAE